MILICLCVAHVTAVMTICVGPTAGGNTADSFWFCKYGGRQVIDSYVYWTVHHIDS